MSVPSSGASSAGARTSLRRTIRELDLVTVCEDAGCPNLSECWADGTATFMVLGERCTRACGFCLVDTSKPLAPAAGNAVEVACAMEVLTGQKTGPLHELTCTLGGAALFLGGLAETEAAGGEMIAEAIRTEFGLYYLNYHSRLPTINGVTGTIAGALAADAAASPATTSSFESTR